ncbi:hypothetical protein A2380_03930 [candidate division WWE3 bacterium RIFOXYB1_FULL_43_24]|uniref:Pectate lyase-related protein n=2 Tax=Katanobacteria TaxID=422282 RepID=A0A0G0YR56_UNCKA|nr:MAG: Pectate lyase-related protein [candidate division WWE3 bacterium GW2011_GWA1_42_12]KKS33779.1 MAG: Pectate lyase-related protein [candidate division WWE3 bacterium GW2011_GWD1_42_14]KKS39117.1 MAG: Pectate lyase-related protein [candidate division WWE3 bacterium GW2011_GWF1_42_14]KKS40647.1 MAG: Pectate lyase-related protein [candidate division WWE3 bacterium GW2011_GWE1_42_16]OGC69283.1 MAG: hypothetical protein A2380_03930 [candidate division WWE3 bacterium RIFOXYB1_FULL_43_24]OGC734
MFKKYGFFVTIFSFFLLFSTRANAATYYVSTKGSDSNPGTITQPWRTIQKAANTLAPGDTANVGPGIYNENVTLTRSGTTGSPIIIQGTTTPRIAQSTPTNTSCLSSENACVLGYVSINGSQIVFKKMEVAGAPVKPGSIAGITVNGNTNEVSENFVHNSWKEGIIVKPGTSSNLILNNYITYSSITAGISFDGQNHLIQGNTITHSVTRQPDRSAPTGASDPDGMRFFGSGTVVRNNVIRDIFLDESPESDDPHSDCFQTWTNANNITFDGNYCELENTTTYSNPMVKFMMIETPASGTLTVGDIKIINNIFVSKSMSALWTPIQLGNESCSTSYPLRNFTIANNTFVHTGNTVANFAILMRCADTVSIRNNAIYNFGTSVYPYIYQDKNNNTNVTISNNSVFNSTGVIPKGGAYPGDNISEIWLKNPEFVDVTNLNLQLKSTSPLINRGVTVSEVSYDYNKVARPQGTAYDIGAYEYTEGVVTPTTPSTTSVLSVCKTGCTYSTIQSAINAASAGKTIEVQAGIYNESLSIGVNGTSTGWITLQAKPGDVVWIDGSTLGNVSNINLGNHSYWKIIGLKMRAAAQGSVLGADGAADGVTVGVGGNNIVLQNLAIEAPNADGIDLRGANYNIQILGNEIYEMRKLNPSYYGDGHGVHVLQQRGVAASHDILVRGNLVHDAHGKACLALSDFTALNAPRPTNIVFEHNIVRDCTNGIKINADGIFRYNLVVDSGKYTTGVEKPDSCFQAFTHDAENNVRDARVYNNTAVGCNNAYNFDMVYNGSTPTQTFTVFKNNIAFNPRVYYVRVSGTILSSEGNNLFYKPVGTASYIGYTPGSTSIINTDPQLNLDYTLKSSSPAIDKGAVIDTSLPYSGTSPDIGAYEFQSTVPTPAPDPLPKPGDANGDNLVNDADFVIWYDHYNLSVSGVSNGDFNADNFIDGADYVVWLNNYGK